MRIAVAAALGDPELADSIMAEMGEEEIDEAELAKKMDIGLEEVRKLLYRLHEANLAHQTRVKELEERERMVFWRLNPEGARDFLLFRFRRIRALLERRKAIEESTEFYSCAADPTHCRIPFDEILGELMGGSPTCPVCGALLEPSSGEELAEKIGRLIDLMNEVISFLEER